MSLSLLEQALQLPEAERRALAEALYGSLSADPLLTDQQLADLKARLERLDREDGDIGFSWNQVKSETQRRFRP